MEKGQFFQWSWKQKRNRLNKDIKKGDFRKYPTNLIETNHQINMTSEHFVSSNMLFKSDVSAKSFNLILGIVLPSIFEKHKTCLNRTKSLLILNLSNIISKDNEDFAIEQRSVI